jgi:alginate O-acetyltransferase complex protein AlgJ
VQRSIDLPVAALDGKVVEGRAGRLFVADDGNHVLSQHTGRLRFTAEQLARWRALLETRAAWLARRSSAYLFLIPPDAHAVYPDLLPPGIESAPERPVHQLLAHLRAHDSSVRPVYALDQVVAHRDECVFPETGSHWTGLGAFYGYRALVDAVGDSLALRPLSRGDVTTSEVVVTGDLGAKVIPPRRSRWVNVQLRRPRARVVADNRVRNRGRRVTYEGGGPCGDCLVFGDSFGMRLLPLLAESFRRLTFAHMPDFDTELVHELEPEVVLTEMAERALIVIPADVPGSWRSVAEKKLAAGDVIPPRGDPQPPAPAAADRVQEPPA